MTVDVDTFFNDSFPMVTMQGEPFIEYRAPALTIEGVQHETKACPRVPAKVFLAEESDGAQAAFHIGALGIKRVVKVKDEHHLESGTVKIDIAGHTDLAYFARS